MFLCQFYGIFMPKNILTQTTGLNVLKFKCSSIRCELPCTFRVILFVVSIPKHLKMSSQPSLLFLCIPVCPLGPRLFISYKVDVACTIFIATAASDRAVGNTHLLPTYIRSVEQRSSLNS